METILEQSQRRFPFDDNCRIAFLIGANEQKQQELEQQNMPLNGFGVMQNIYRTRKQKKCSNTGFMVI